MDRSFKPKTTEECFSGKLCTDPPTDMPTPTPVRTDTRQQQKQIKNAKCVHVPKGLMAGLSASTTSLTQKDVAKLASLTPGNPAGTMNTARNAAATQVETTSHVIVLIEINTNIT